MINIRSIKKLINDDGLTLFNVLAGLLFALDDLFFVRDGYRIYDRLEETSLRYWLLVSALAAFIIIFGVYGSGFDAQSFVYFQF